MSVAGEGIRTLAPEVRRRRPVARKPQPPTASLRSRSPAAHQLGACRWERPVRIRHVVVVREHGRHVDADVVRATLLH